MGYNGGITTMGGRAGGGARGSMGYMAGRSSASMTEWNRTVEKTVAKLTGGLRNKNGKFQPVTGAARKNTIETLKQLAKLHPTAAKLKQITKYPGFNADWLK